MIPDYDRGETTRPNAQSESLPPNDAHAQLLAAGFTADSAGPLHWRCHVRLGAWTGTEHAGYPLRWDACLAEAVSAFPGHFVKENNQFLASEGSPTKSGSDR